MRHSQRINHRLLQLFDDVVQSTNIFKRHGDIIRRNDIHGDGLFVLIESQFAFSLPATSLSVSPAGSIFLRFIAIV